MGLVVLLLNPAIKKFELIQFPDAPNSSANTGNLSIERVLQQAEASASHPELKSQTHVGLYCPKTQQTLLLPASTGSALPEESTEKPVDNDSDNKDTKTAAEVDAATVATYPPAANDHSEEPTEPTNMEETESNDNDNGNGNDQPDESLMSEPVPEPPTEASSPAPSADTTAEENASNGSKKDKSPPANPFAHVGHILVAIPEGRPIDQIQQMSASILKSPSFAILTQGTANSTLYRIENPSTTQELAQLQEQGLTQQVASRYQQHVQENQRSTQLHQLQTKDLESRKTSPRNKPNSPDAHGLSPLDTLRVAQNKEKAAARQQEQATKQTYQRHADTRNTGGLLNTQPPKTSTSSPKANDSMAVVSPSSTNSTPPAENGTFSKEQQQYSDNNKTLSQSQSLQNQTQDELEVLRQQGRVSVSSKKDSFGPENPDRPSSIVSSSEQRRASIEAQKHNELESLKKIQTKKSTRALLEDPDRPAILLSPSEERRASIEAQKRTELESLSKIQKTSLRALPISKETRKLSATSQSELEALRGRGLAQSVKERFVEAERSSAVADQAHQAQVEDLEARKAKTGKFEVSRNSLHLSAADAKALEVSQQKKQERAQEREALGYYQSRPANALDDELNDEDWQTKGKVHISQRTTNTFITKEWDAGTTQTSSVVTMGTNTTLGSPTAAKDGPTTAQESSRVTNGKTTTEAKQGCACTVM